MNLGKIWMTLLPVFDVGLVRGSFANSGRGARCLVPKRLSLKPHQSLATQLAIILVGPLWRGAITFVRGMIVFRFRAR